MGRKLKSIIIFAKEKVILFFKLPLVVMILLFALMSVTFSTNLIDSQNQMFVDFELFSEELALSAIEAGENGLQMAYYGLGRKQVIQLAEVEEPGYVHSFSTTEATLILVKNAYTDEYIVPGNTLVMVDGASYKIIDVEECAEDSIKIFVDAPKSIYVPDYEYTEYYKVLDAEGEICPYAVIEPYYSQYGLQGKVYRLFSRLYSGDAVALLRIVAACALSAVLSAIVYGIYKKYNFLMAACFYLVFLLSPWVVCFARNLYWIPFTWFLPMLIGLFCPLDNKRFIFYMLAFIAILVKSLCGYEYLSTILIGMVLFPLADWVAEKNKEKKWKITQNIFFLGICAILAFFVALVMHAGLRGNGNVLEGLGHIWNEDVLRRTHGAYENFAATDNDAHSLQASIWDTLCLYLRFPTQIIVGLDGNMFLILIGLALAIVLKKELKNTAGSKQAYALFFFALAGTLSWFVLAKAHSYRHPHMNFVLWYFGFVQMSIYLIAAFVKKWYKKHISSKNGEHSLTG